MPWKDYIKHFSLCQRSNEDNIYLTEYLYGQTFTFADVLLSMGAKYTIIPFLEVFISPPNNELVQQMFLTE